MRAAHSWPRESRFRRSRIEVERGDLAGERAYAVGRRAAVATNQRLEFLGVALFHRARSGQELFQLVLLDLADQFVESNDAGALGFEQKIECLFERRVHNANLVRGLIERKARNYLYNMRSEVSSRKTPKMRRSVLPDIFTA